MLCQRLTSFREGFAKGFAKGSPPLEEVLPKALNYINPKLFL